MNQKLENLLQIALQLPEAERMQNPDLQAGISDQNNSWELIVKYHGSLDGLSDAGIGVEYLIAGYAILTVPGGLVEEIAGLEQIEYVEKPKAFYTQQIDPGRDSCLQELLGRGLSLSGKGVVIAILDSGIDYRLQEFRQEDGGTRIRYLWDQTAVPGQGFAPPAGFLQGVELTQAQINAALLGGGNEPAPGVLPTMDITGHGTAVAGIAAGRSARYKGVAPEADLLIVKLGTAQNPFFPGTSDIMRGVTWALQRAETLGEPLIINLSYGSTYGAHDGSSLLERFLDNAAEIGRTVICVGSGNEGAARGHLAGELRSGTARPGETDFFSAQPTTRPGAGASAAVELSVGEFETNLSLQLWKNYSDSYRIRLQSPGGEEAVIATEPVQRVLTYPLEQTNVQVFVGEPSPYSVAQEIYLNFVPRGRPYVNSGVWRFVLEGLRIVTGKYYLYLSPGAGNNARTGFFEATPLVTLTIPSTASKVITVGAYDSTYDAYADFSGRGYADSDRTVGVVTAGIAKPDLAAPGVGIPAPDRFGGYLSVTGTSFSTPIVSGAAALLAEWGIVQGNDPFLYAEKVKAYFRRGAQPIRGETTYPNAKVGWGKLCVAQSIPEATSI